MCLDEVSKDDCTYTRLWGRSVIGSRVKNHDPFMRKRRFSMVAALALDEGIVAAKVVEGLFNRETFMEYLRDDVVSNLNYLQFYPSTNLYLASDVKPISWTM
jgi:hypothetical protein